MPFILCVFDEEGKFSDPEDIEDYEKDGFEENEHEHRGLQAVPLLLVVLTVG